MVVVGNSIRFELHYKVADRKTDIWTILSNYNGIALGEVRFYGAWRKFCFFPSSDTIFDANCLREIVKFCEDQTSAWRGS